MNNLRKLDSILTYSGKGVTPKYVAESSIIVLNQKCIRNNKIDYSLAQYIDDGKQYNAEKFLSLGDILINSTGQGTAGRVAFVDKLPIDKKVIIDSHILVIRTSNYFESKCLNYSLFSIEKQLQTFMDGSTGQGEFDKQRLFNVFVNYSNDSQVQKKIANILTDIDNKIELNNKLNDNLEQMAKTLYDYWFVQFDFPDKNGKPYKSSGGKMIWNDVLKREIPEGWEVNIIDNILKKNDPNKKVNTKKYLHNGLIPVIDQSTNYIAGYINEKKYLISSSSEKPLIVFGDHTRILKLINFDFARGADGTQLLISGNERVTQYYFYHLLLKIDLSNYGYARHFKFLKDSIVIIPPMETTVYFDQSVRIFYNNILKNQKQNQQLSSLRDWLLPMLMNGQVKVE